MEKIDLEIINFLSKNNLSDYDISPLPNDASDRTYYRLSRNNQTLVLMDASKAISTVKSFLKVTTFLAKKEYSVPEVFCADIKNGYLILEDLGNHTLDNYLIKHPEHLSTVYYCAVDLVVALSSLANPTFPKFDNTFFLNELSIFVDWYLPYIGNLLSKKVLENFNTCWNKPLEYLLLNDSNNVFVHKDMHCRNLFWLPQRLGKKSIGIIDFQSAKSGSFVYDITSLIYDCRFPMSQGMRQNFLNKFMVTKQIDPNIFKNLCDIYVAQRNIKILGNFAHIYKQKNNSSYLKYLPSVWSLVHESLDNPILKDVKAWFLQNKIHTQ